MNISNLLNRDNTDCMKGIAILMIMLAHMMTTFNVSRFFTPLGGIGVAIFLFLSAYGLSESYKNNGLRCWVRKRIISVFLPYAIAQIVLYWSVNEFDSIAFLKDLTLVTPALPIGWYLNYLLWCYISFYIIMAFPVFRENKIVIFSILSLCSFLFLPEIRAEQSLSFLTGVVVSEYKTTNKLNFINAKYGLYLIAGGGNVFSH